jgi:hypothetical protein
MTKKTKKGKTILKPRVPTKLTNNMGKSEDCFPELANIYVIMRLLLKLRTQDDFQLFDAVNTFAERMNATTLSLIASHASLISHPDETAEFILNALKER